MEKARYRQQERDRAAEIIIGNTSVEWNTANPTWNDLSPADVIALTSQIARIIDFTPDQAKKVKVVFGDHRGFNVPFITSHTHPVFCCGAVRFQDLDQYSHCLVVINRSLELAEKTFVSRKTRFKTKADELTQIGVLDETSPQSHLECYFETHREFVTWLIAEELKHAHILLTAGAASMAEEWKENYLSILLKKGIQRDQVYAVDIGEIAASRVALQVLTQLSSNHDRKEYFRNLYLQSLQQVRHVTPMYKPAFFVPTGFNPSSLRQIVFRFLCI